VPKVFECVRSRWDGGGRWTSPLVVWGVGDHDFAATVAAVRGYMDSVGPILGDRGCAKIEIKIPLDDCWASGDGSHECRSSLEASLWCVSIAIALGVDSFLRAKS
jgi:hypothetical protein